MISDCGEDLYLIIDDIENPIQIELNVESAQDVISLLAELIIQAKAVQKMRSDEYTMEN